MEELSYSLHLGNDKNKSRKARNVAKTNDTNTTSYGNSAIQNQWALSKVDKHNLRKYDNDKDLIYTIKGTSSVVEDTKNLYLDLFEDARIKYNEKQKRNDRKIDNYFNHISNDNKRDLACEIIIELGDMDFWADKKKEYQMKMVKVFQEQIEDLESVVPNFKIANATIHFDESSPHLHIVGVPFKDGSKNGMEKQVGKSDVFTVESLQTIQDRMREYCIASFNRIYNVDYTLKEKQEGRNIDIITINMRNYREFKKQKEKHKKKLDELNNKANELQTQTNNIELIINKLKTSKLNKNNFTISNEDVDKIKDYLEIATETTNNLKTSNDLIATLDKYDNDLREHNKLVKDLNRKIDIRDDRISELEYDLEIANETIDELEEKISTLEIALNKLKEIWNKFIEFLQDKFFSTNKYDDLINQLYEKKILNNDDIDIIQNKKTNEKDDLEL